MDLLFLFANQIPRIFFRDLKPSNIMLVNHSQGVILDFGSMTPASITMTTRSEAQQWQVSDSRYLRLLPVI